MCKYFSNISPCCLKNIGKIGGLGLTDALIGLLVGGSRPGSVVVERFALLTVRPGRVVFAVAHLPSVAPGRAAARVAVALASAADGEVGQRVVVGLARLLVRLLVSVRVETVEHDLDVGGRHPVLQHGAVVEVIGGGSALERREADARPAQRVDVAVGVGAERLLLVDLRDDGARRFPVHLLALTRVELKRHPRFPVVHRLVDGHGVRAR